MRKLLILIGIFLTVLGVSKFLQSIRIPAHKPCPDSVENVETSTTTTETIEMPEPEPEPQDDFKPLPFTGKNLKRFAKKYGGRIVTVGGIKTVKVGEDYYYKDGEGLYVRHNGEVIKLN